MPRLMNPSQEDFAFNIASLGDPAINKPRSSIPRGLSNHHYNAEIKEEPFNRQPFSKTVTFSIKNTLISPRREDTEPSEMERHFSNLAIATAKRLNYPVPP